MIFYASLIVLPVALWLWWPLLQRERRGAFWLAFVITALLGAMPAALIWVMRNTQISYFVIAHLQVVAGWMFSALMLAFLLAVLRDVVGLLGVFTPHSRRLFTAVIVAVALLVTGFGVTQALKVPRCASRK
ncbi:hypothetical protein [Diaphorobacter aerolatus]|uniref:hypothetical protein n=1 Tax=Diaphorobacter aerolatus TaxID=1288495 RepID=UPI001D0320DC|nr:hypothetical protein [Diaphorobacter aerolatus]